MHPIAKVRTRPTVHHHQHLLFCEKEPVAVASILCAMATYHFQRKRKKSKHISIRFRFHFHYLSWLELMGAHFNSVVDCRTTIDVYARLCLATLTQMNGQFPVVIAQLNLYLECIYDCVQLNDVWSHFRFICSFYNTRVHVRDISSLHGTKVRQ